MEHTLLSHSMLTFIYGTYIAVTFRADIHKKDITFTLLQEKISMLFIDYSCQHMEHSGGVSMLDGPTHF
jgi:hypothetical protein